MSEVDSGGFRFVSHHRRGLIALPGVAAAGKLTASAVLSDGTVTPPVTLGLASVGHVMAIDLTLVTRQYPVSGATDVETEFFPLVEFTTPELPWMLPGPADARGPLPWLCLVAVEARDGVAVTSSGAGKLDVLHIDGSASPAEELPDPADAGLWAHAFAATTVHTSGSADPTETGAEALAGCRLIAPRRLQPQKTYFVCLVPTLAAAALAGLGRSDQEIAAALAATQPSFAWSPTDKSVQLPVYMSWQFSCGDGGDFETLARSLKEVEVDAAFGTRPLDLGLAGPGMPTTTTTKRLFRGALTAPGAADPPAWPDASDPDQKTIDDALASEIGDAAAITATAAATGHERPAVGPLLYARAAAGKDDVAAAAPAPTWFDELNRDPAIRSVAGLGSRVLRRNVEDVMGRAWQQVGEVEAANAVLRRLQMSRAVSTSLHQRHLATLAAGTLLSAARPVLPRVALPAAATGGAVTASALAAVAASALPAGSTWRGLSVALRPGTRLGEAARAAGGGTATSAVQARGRYLASLAVGIAEPGAVPDGTLSLAPPSAVLGARATMLLGDELRTAAAAASLPVPAADADPATIAQGLDALAAGASHLSTAASTNIAFQTGAIVRGRALPSTVTLSEVAGVLVSQDQLRARAGAGPVAVISPTSVSPTVLEPDVSAAALGTGVSVAPHAGVALVRAAETHRATTAASAPAAVAVPIGRPVATPAPISVSVPSQPAPIATPIAVGAKALTPTVLQLAGADARLSIMRDAYAHAIDRLIRPGTSTAAPEAGALDLEGAKTAILANLHPAITVAKLAGARVPAIVGLSRPDPVAPIMVGPVFGEAAYMALVQASHDAFVPGLDSIPTDSVTLLQTNPTFIAAYLAGLNSALGHELLWRGFPTDERGTYWHSFWGTGPDIRPLHLFSGHLLDNVAAGAQPLLVLVLRGRLLSRYPDSDIYAVAASGNNNLPELEDGTLITRPLFRDFIGPDITLVGFPLTYAQITGGDGGRGHWFVLAEHPGRPRFGLTDPDAAVPHPPLPSWDELSWDDLGAAHAATTYLPAVAPPLAPAGTTRAWGASAADMAAITYQPAVRVAIRASDLLKRSTS